MPQHPVIAILSRWPSRQALHEDLQKRHPDLDMVAVHRWFKRLSIPARYWSALVDGASAKPPVTADELMHAHDPAAEQTVQQIVHASACAPGSAG